jgi:hypothetical protein
MPHQPLLPSRRGFLIASALAAAPAAWAVPAVAGRSGVGAPVTGRPGTPVTVQWYDLTNQAVNAAAFPEAITQSRTWAVSWLAAARATGLSNDPFTPPLHSRRHCTTRWLRRCQASKHS